MEIVINKCFGGFGLSTQALYELIKMNSSAIEKMRISEYSSNVKNFQQFKDKYTWPRYKEYKDGYVWDEMIPVLFKDDYVFCLKDDYENKTERFHLDVIKIVKKLGTKANGTHAKLEIIEIPDNIKWEIDNYDGMESVHEKHRSW